MNTSPSLSARRPTILFIASKRVISTFDFDVGNFQVLDESIANPDFHLVGDILNKIERPDLIIAVGGGSSIDLANFGFA